MNTNIQRNLVNWMKNVMKSLSFITKSKENSFLSKYAFFQKDIIIEDKIISKNLFNFPKLNTISLKLSSDSVLFKNKFKLQRFVRFFNTFPIKHAKFIEGDMSNIKSEKFLEDLENVLRINAKVKSLKFRNKHESILKCMLQHITQKISLIGTSQNISPKDIQQIQSLISLNFENEVNQEYITNIFQSIQDPNQVSSMKIRLDQNYSKGLDKKIWNFMNLQDLNLGLYYTEDFYDIIDPILSNLSKLRNFELRVSPTKNIKPLKLEIIFKLLSKFSLSLTDLKIDFSENSIQLGRSNYNFEKIMHLTVYGIFDLPAASNLISLCNPKAKVDLNSIQVIQKGVTKFGEFMTSLVKNDSFNKIFLTLHFSTIDIRPLTFMGFFMNFLNSLPSERMDLKIKVTFDAKEKPDQYITLLEWTKLRPKSSALVILNKYSFLFCISKINIMHEPLEI